MDSSDLFSSSPVKEPAFYARDERPKTPKTPTAKTPQQTPPQKQQQQQQQTHPFDAEEARDAALQRELDGVRQINRVIEGVIGTLEQSRGNMSVGAQEHRHIPFFFGTWANQQTVAQTVGNASALLNTWTRLLSQTEHNQRLLLDPQWQGATQDLQALEAEALQRQQEAERRAAEAQRRRDDAKRKAEEDERRRLAAPSASSSTSRGPSSRGRGLRSGGRIGTRGVGRTTYGTSSRGVGSRGSSTATGSGSTTTFSGLTRSSSTSASGNARSGSNIGRGFGAPRGTRASGRGVQ